MRQISDELLLNEIKELINSKKTPLTKKEVLNWISSEINSDAYRSCLFSHSNMAYNAENRINQCNEICERNKSKLQKAYNLINSLENYDRI